MRYRKGALVAAVSLVLTGCGSGSEEPAAGGSDDAAAAVRIVEHALGSTEIEGTPERVVVLDTGELDTVLALGVTPVGAVRTAVSDELPSYIEDAGADPARITNVGTIQQPNLEEIAAPDPDLILTNVVRHEAVHEQLSAIAPTVMAGNIGETWKENLLPAGEALNRTDEAQRLLAAHEQRAAEVGRLYGNPAGTEVSMVRFTDPTAIRLYGEGSFVGAVLDDVGFARPQVQQTDETFVEVSREEVTRADGDVVFHSSHGQEGRTAAAEVTGGALWQSIPAVQEGRAFEVGDDRWFLAIGPLGAELVLDDLEQFAGQLSG